MNDFELTKVKEIFHARSSAVSLATSDQRGTVNTAPVGSAIIADGRTVELLRGPLIQTYKNLKENPDAVFMAVNNSVLNWLRFLFTGDFGASYGYRVHTRLREEKEITEEDKLKVLKKRFGFLVGLKGGRKICRTVNKILIFDIIKSGK